MTQQKADYPLNYSNGPLDDRPGKPTETASEQLKSVAQNAQDMAEKVTEQARQYGEKAQEAAKNFKPYVEKSMKEQPMTTLAVASVIGFVLGALWRK